MIINNKAFYLFLLLFLSFRLSSQRIRIVLTGGPCSGKTITLNALKEKFGDRCYIIPEASRIIIDEFIEEEKMFIDNAGKIDFIDSQYVLEFQIRVIQKQIEQESAIPNDNDLTIIQDRSLIDSLAYSQEYGLDIPTEIITEVNEILERNRFDLILYYNRDQSDGRIASENPKTINKKLWRSYSERNYGYKKTRKKDKRLTKSLTETANRIRRTLSGDIRKIPYSPTIGEKIDKTKIVISEYFDSEI